LLLESKDVTDPRQIEAISLLDEPLRRRLYDYVRERRAAVGRDEAAGACGISRSLAAFHLDRLAQAGLLAVEFRRLSGRTGRGAGRPAKLYRVSEERFSFTLPETRAVLAWRILAHTVEERGPDESPESAVRRMAARTGRELGQRFRAAGRPARPGESGVAFEVLAELAFEPERRGERILLRNCPFHELLDTHRNLVCALNHSLLLGLVQGLAASGLTARPRSHAGYCCVEITPA
jgi:predicted ArsR family transcriptional regulator